MTTVAVKQSTLEKLKRIMKQERKASLDQTINSLIDKNERIPETMFGADKTRKLKLRQKEHEEFQRSHFS
jgi:predicted nucleic acid-binding protein